MMQPIGLERSEKLLEAIGLIDDPDAEWPIVPVLRLLGFRPSPIEGLQSFWGGRGTVSLREIFDLIISEQPDPRPGYLIVPLLDFRHFGRKGLFTLIDQVTELDLGERCTALWQQKYALLRAAHRLCGRGSSSNSFPITEQGKRMARLKTGQLLGHSRKLIREDASARRPTARQGSSER